MLGPAKWPVLGSEDLDPSLCSMDCDAMLQADSTAPPDVPESLLQPSKGLADAREQASRFKSRQIV